MSTTHERDIPGIASQAVVAKAESCYTELSLCLPTSLAFAKRLTWEQTPWIPVSNNQTSANPISEADAHIIAYHLSSHLEQRIAPEAIQNALLFGSTYPASPSDEELGSFPHLFVVFPHARGNVSRDETFLKVFHDEIVKPAFDRAWKDSGLAPIYGAEVDGQTRILPPTGTRTPRDALPASGFLTRLRNGNPAAVRDYWPIWTDDWGVGAEGRHSGARAKIYHEAWEAITGMLKGHPGLRSFQDPVLLALARGRIDVAPDLPVPAKVKCVGQEWDKFVDSRFMKRGSFKVVFQTVVGARREGAVLLGLEEVAQSAWIGDAMGRNFKRMAEEEDGKGNGDGDGDGHRNKRSKRAGEGAAAG